MSKRSIAGQEMIGFCAGATDKINWVETIARQADLPITANLDADLTKARTAIAWLGATIRKWMQEQPE